ncbi:hypothetical protein ACFFHJ_12275 [Planotetraspora thailandica]|nr:hypothetical protein [Planotetraspora thailandica]
MHPAVRQLTQILPPPLAEVEVLAWDDIQAEWGTAFPRDFRDFMDIYGQGSIDDLVAVAPPENRAGEPGVRTVRRVAPGVESEFHTFYGEVVFPAWPAPGSLLRWGVTPIGYDLMWRVTGGDPDEWPVVVAGYRPRFAFEFPYGMAEFLVRMLGDRLERPTNLPGIVGYPHSRFLSDQEEGALQAAGQDPWAYLDDFWEERERERAEQGEVTWIAGPGYGGGLPPVARLTVEGFGLDGDDLRVSATLDVEPSGPVRATVYIEGPPGSVLHCTGLVPEVDHVNGLVVLDIRLSAALNDTGMSWREMVQAMSHEDDWRLAVTVEDPAIGAARARHGIVVGHNMQESAVDIAWGSWP